MGSVDLILLVLLLDADEVDKGLEEVADAVDVHEDLLTNVFALELLLGWGCCSRARLPLARGSSWLRSSNRAQDLYDWGLGDLRMRPLAVVMHGLTCWAAHRFLAVAPPHPGAVDSRAVRVDVHDGNATVWQMAVGANGTVLPSSSMISAAKRRNSLMYCKEHL